MEQGCSVAYKVYEYLKSPFFLHRQQLIQFVSFVVISTAAVTADAGFLCDEPAAFGVSIKETSCIIHTLYFPTNAHKL